LDLVGSAVLGVKLFRGVENVDRLRGVASSLHNFLFVFGRLLLHVTSSDFKHNSS
jgi:hypothetical protein